MAALGVEFAHIGIQVTTLPELSNLGFGGGNFLFRRQRPTRFSFAPLRLERPLGVDIGRALQDAVVVFIAEGVTKNWVVIQIDVVLGQLDQADDDLVPPLR